MKGKTSSKIHIFYHFSPLFTFLSLQVWHIYKTVCGVYMSEEQMKGS